MSDNTAFPLGTDLDGPATVPPPGSRRWLPVAAGLAAVLVAGLAVYLLLLRGSGDETSTGPVPGALRKPAAAPTPRAGVPPTPSAAVTPPASLVGRNPFQPLYVPQPATNGALGATGAGTTTTGTGTLPGSTGTGTTGTTDPTGTTGTTGGSVPGSPDGAVTGAPPAEPVPGDPRFTG